MRICTRHCFSAPIECFNYACVYHFKVQILFSDFYLNDFQYLHVHVVQTLNFIGATASVALVLSLVPMGYRLTRKLIIFPPKWQLLDRATE